LNSTQAQRPLLQLIGQDSFAFAPQSIRPTPDGHWLLAVNAASGKEVRDFSGFIKMTDQGGIVEAQSIIAPPGKSHRILDIHEIPGGDRIALLQHDEDSLPGIVSARYFLKRYRPDFSEVWSLYLAGRWFLPQDYPGLSFDAAGNIYGAIRRSFNPEGGQTHFIFKVSPTGQFIWAKDTPQYPNGLLLEPDNNVLVTLNPRNDSRNGMLVRLAPDGAPLKTVQFNNMYVRDIARFPDGDLLLGGYFFESEVTDKFLVRLRAADWSVRGAWRISGVSRGFERRNFIIFHDDLLYYFADPTGGERGRIALRMDGSGRVQKSVLVPELINFSVEPRAADAGHFWLPSGFVTALGEVGLLRFDSTLQLPNCPAQPYCVKVTPTNVTISNATPTFSVFTPEVRQIRFLWENRQPVLRDYCSGYTAPKAFFTLPDTVCTGVLVRPDGLLQETAAAWAWSFQKGQPDTSSLRNPSVVFPTPGRFRIRHSVRYLGCALDTFSRVLTVLASPGASLGRDTVLCPGRSVVLTAASAGGQRWRWDDGSTAPVRTVQAGGQYSVTVSNGFCQSADTITVRAAQASAAFDLPDTLCVGAPVRPIPVTTSGQHHWKTEPPVLASSQEAVPRQWVFNTVGTFRIVHSLEAQGCSTTAEHPVEVLESPALEVGGTAFLCRDSTLLLQPDTQRVTGFRWQDGFAGLDRIIERPGEYVLTAEKNGCLVSDTVRITGKDCRKIDIFVPNIFAPGSTGSNAFFTIDFNQNTVRQMQLLEIFDRWGSLLFRSTDPQSPGWDGTRSGEVLQPGVYIWRANFLLSDGQLVEKRGEVMLIR
jgi:gliding motility-associated-like protein